MWLILLTGCRSGEVRRLRWRDVKRDRLMLHEAKTGPRQVSLGEAARALLDRLSKTRSGEWVFPGAARGGHMSAGVLYWFWRRVRDEAGIIADARLHDLRHSCAAWVSNLPFSLIFFFFLKIRNQIGTGLNLLPDGACRA